MNTCKWISILIKNCLLMILWYVQMLKKSVTMLVLVVIGHLIHWFFFILTLFFPFFFSFWTNPIHQKKKDLDACAPTTSCCFSGSDAQRAQWCEEDTPWTVVELGGTTETFYVETGGFKIFIFFTSKTPLCWCVLTLLENRAAFFPIFCTG